MSDVAVLQRRIAALREARTTPVAPVDGRSEASERLDRSTAADRRDRSIALAHRLAAAIDGEVVDTRRGRFVRREVADVVLRLDRERLSRLPGWPAETATLVCLDTETTGLATAAGTIAFLVGVGRWSGDAFRQVQLLMPDQSDEPALLEALAALIPGDAWLVTYNGRGFDWPLLEARYRMDRQAAPRTAGHLDLLPFVRRVYRHRLVDARLRSVEGGLLGVVRSGDVDGWEIPGRYLEFLRGAPAAPLRDVVEHNERDVLSLAGLLRHVGGTLAHPDRRADPAAGHVDPGDLAGLARVFRAARRHAEALACLDGALARLPSRSDAAHELRGLDALFAERARTLRRLGRSQDALAAWRTLAAAGGPFTGIALVEVAKALEHRWSDPLGALEAVELGRVLADRARAIGRPMPNLEADLSRRRSRLVARISRRRARPARPSVAVPA